MSTEFNTPQDAISFAIDFIAKAHGGDFRNGEGDLRVPYLIHPLDVMREIFHFGIRDARHLNIWLTALNHDVDEGTDQDLSVIADLLNREVADYVGELTFRDRLPDESPQDYQKEKSEHLADFINKSLVALVVKIADRLCNVRDYLNSGDKRYARKYFYRAKGLFEAFEARKDEIIAEFGRPVFEKIRQRIETVLKSVSY